MTEENKNKATAKDTGKSCKKHDHTAIVSQVSHELPKEERLCDLADLFKIFGDTTRMRILCLKASFACAPFPSCSA